MKRLILLALVLLAACGTPQEQCINRSTRDLRIIDKLIAETEANIERGYAYERTPVRENYWDYCPQRQLTGAPPVPMRLCLKERVIFVDRPKAIDLEEEARKLASLKAKRKELARIAEEAIALCKAEYPA